MAEEGHLGAVRWKVYTSKFRVPLKMMSFARMVTTLFPVDASSSVGSRSSPPSAIRGARSGLLNFSSVTRQSSA